MARDSKQSYSYNGEVYGPGRPEGFSVADLDKASPEKKSNAASVGQVKTPSGEVVNRMNETAEDTGSVNKDGGVVSHPASATQHKGETLASLEAAGGGESEEELEKLSKSELQDMAADRGVEVTRQDGDAGAPTKADFVAALAR